MSTVDPGALVITSDRYLPSPSWVMPRWTGMFSFGTSLNFTVLFSPLKIASETSLPTFSMSMSNAAEISISEMW